MTTIISAVVQWALSFFTGKLFGSKSESHKQAEKAVEDYREGEKIDAYPDVDGKHLLDFFKRLRK